MAKKDFEEIKKEVKKLVSDITKVPEKDLIDEASFIEELGIDSMMALEIIVGIEKKYRKVIPEEKISTVRSMSDVYKLLQEILN